MAHGRSRATVFTLSLCLVIVAQVCQGQTAKDKQQLQRQFQRYLQQLQFEEAKIADRQAAFGEKAYDETKDAIKELIQEIKISNPSEDSGDPKQWIEFANKLGELVQWYTQTLDDIGDSTNELGALDARLGKLNQSLAEAKVAVRKRVTDLKAFDQTIRNRQITLQPIPTPPRADWSELDKAIESMRKEDQPYLESARVGLSSGSGANPCASFLEAVHKAERAGADCSARFASCSQPCPDYMPNNKAFAACMEKCFCDSAPLSKAVADLQNCASVARPTVPSR